MYGAIIGDICGSRYEGARRNTMNKYVEIFPVGCRCTDDTAMTVAIADALMMPADTEAELKENFIVSLVTWARRYPHAGYGGKFKAWFKGENHEPYNSYGNGSGMRVSPCGLAAKSLEDALRLAKLSAEVTHNHPEGIKGAQAIAACTYLAKTGSTKEEIRKYVDDNFYYIAKNSEELLQINMSGCSCMTTVPIAIWAFLDSEDFEDAIRNALSVGGDTDTIAAMAGSIAWSYYMHQNSGKLTMEMECMMEMDNEFIPDEIKSLIYDFEEFIKDH